MAMKDVMGEGNDGLVLAVTAISGTTPIVSGPIYIGDKDAVSLQLIVAGGTTPHGSWKVEASNNFIPAISSSPVGGSSSGSYGSPANAGDWDDITALFSKPATIAAVTDNSSQYVQADPHCAARHIRVTFTPASGSGNVSVQCYRKNWSR